MQCIYVTKGDVMQATKYIIHVDGKLHGYNRLDLLRVDLATNKPDNYTVYRNESLFSLRYVEMTQNELTELLTKGDQNEKNG